MSLYDAFVQHGTMETFCHNMAFDVACHHCMPLYEIKGVGRYSTGPYSSMGAILRLSTTQRLFGGIIWPVHKPSCIDSYILKIFVLYI